MKAFLLILLSTALFSQDKYFEIEAEGISQVSQIENVAMTVLSGEFYDQYIVPFRCKGPSREIWDPILSEFISTHLIQLTPQKINMYSIKYHYGIKQDDVSAIYEIMFDAIKFSYCKNISDKEPAIFF